VSGLDDVARSVAGEMPRRRALRVIAGAVAAAVVPGWLAAPARARRVTCITPQKLCRCPSINGLFYEICCSADDECVCKAPPDGYAMCAAKPCPAGRTCGSICCEPNETCADPDLEYCCPPRHTACRGGGTVSCCAPGRACCAGKCCPVGKACHRGTCQRCPQGTRKCGGRCCTKGQTCCNGRCCTAKQKCCFADHCCAKTATCCGETCCTAKQTCCDDHCCTKPKTCCGEGCCAPGTTCVETAGGFACCPDARLVVAGGARVCCPPGDVAAGDRCCPAANPNCGVCDPPCPPAHVCRDGFCLQI